MSIALLGDAGSPHLARLAVDLLARGHRITVLTQAQHPPAPLPEAVTVITYPGPASLATRARALRRILADLKPDVLHSHFINTGGFPAVASGFHPHVMTVWGSDAFVLPYRSRIARLQTALALRAADWVLSPAEAMREAIQTLSGRTSGNEVLPWGVDTGHFRHQPEGAALREKLGVGTGPLVLSLRALTPLYNQDVLIDAWVHVSRAHPQARLLLSRYLADPAFEAALREKISRFKLASSILWMEPVAYADLPAYYSAADLLVSIPSSDAPALTILEALACKTPVLVSDLASLRQWITPDVHGLLVDPRAGDAVAAAINRLLALSIEERQRMGAAGRALVMARADRARCLTQLEEIYRRLAGKTAFSHLRTLRNTLRK